MNSGENTNGHPHPDHHTADPMALEDPVHHDVADHELREERRDDPGPHPGQDGDRATDEGATDEDEEDDEGEIPAAVTEQAVDRGPDGATLDLPECADPQVDAVLAGLSRLRAVPVAEHADIFDQAHRDLCDRLSDIERD